MDPYRPGPTAIVLDRTAMGPVHATGATPVGPTTWRVDGDPSNVTVPLTLLTPEALSPQAMMDGIWRFRFSVAPPEATRACRRAEVTVPKSHQRDSWFTPPPWLHLKPDGRMHTYAIHGNDHLRPAGDTEIALTFHCPPGTVIRWEGAELLRSTMPEAARDLIQHGTPIDPYLHREPRPTTP